MGKHDYYHILKSWLESWSKTRPSSQVGLNVDLDQYNDKNNYYYNLKTQLGGWNSTRPEKVNIKIKIVIIII